MKNKSNNIFKRRFIKGNLKALTPFLIGAYDDEKTDTVVLLDSDEPGANPYLPGTSLAGAMRELCTNESLVKKIFGFTEGDTSSRQSAAYIYESFIKENEEPKYDIRDGIRLKYDLRTTALHAKYDYEIVEPGLNFEVRFEVIFREDVKGEEKKIDALFDMLISKMMKEIYLGSKTNRGLGKFILSDVEEFTILSSDNDAYSKYVNFDWATSGFEKWEDSSGGQQLQCTMLNKEYEINFPGTLVIRDYRVEDIDDNVNYKMLQCGNTPIIPGTSWAGVFRHGARRILYDLNDSFEESKKMPESVITDFIVNAFGSEQNDVSDKKKASSIGFSESMIADSKFVNLNRVAIDRFTQGASDSAHFNEQVCYSGKTILSVRYKEQWQIELIELVLSALDDGYFAIGGEVAVGRGLCKICTPLEHIDGTNLIEKIVKLSEE